MDRKASVRDPNSNFGDKRVSSRGAREPNSIGDRRTSSRRSGEDPSAITDKRVSSRGQRRGSREMNGTSHDEIDFDFTPQILSNPNKQALPAISESDQMKPSNVNENELKP